MRISPILFAQMMNDKKIDWKLQTPITIEWFDKYIIHVK